VLIRYSHAWLRANAESVAFYGPLAVEGAESHRLGHHFSQAVAARWGVLLAHLPLYVCVQFFDYVGTVVNYAAVGTSIFYLSKARGERGGHCVAARARLLLVPLHHQRIQVRGRGKGY
jgi:ABC transporter transmembrane region 2